MGIHFWLVGGRRRKIQVFRISAWGWVGTLVPSRTPSQLFECCPHARREPITSSTHIANVATNGCFLSQPQSFESKTDPPSQTSPKIDFGHPPKKREVMDLDQLKGSAWNDEKSWWNRGVLSLRPFCIERERMRAMRESHNCHVHVHLTRTHSCLYLRCHQWIHTGIWGRPRRRLGSARRQ